MKAPLLLINLIILFTSKEHVGISEVESGLWSAAVGKFCLCSPQWPKSNNSLTHFQRGMYWKRWLTLLYLALKHLFSPWGTFIWRFLTGQRDRVNASLLTQTKKAAAESEREWHTMPFLPRPPSLLPWTEAASTGKISEPHRNESLTYGHTFPCFHKIQDNTVICAYT